MMDYNSTSSSLGFEPGSSPQAVFPNSMESYSRGIHNAAGKEPHAAFFLQALKSTWPCGHTLSEDPTHYGPPGD
jgi:hypothetical protein